MTAPSAAPPPLAGPLAIWDVDGTLVDSRETIAWCMAEGFASQGLPRPGYDETRRIVGLTLLFAIETMTPGLAPAVQAAIADGYRAAFQSLHADPAYREPLYPGAADLLQRLTDAGWRQAVATGKSRRGLDRVVAANGWGARFVSLHSSDDGPGKPDPAMVLAALAATSTPPERAVMIGDTSHDMRMGRAAGVRTLGVTWGFHTADELREAGADVVCTTFAELEVALLTPLPLAGEGGPRREAVGG